MKIKTRRETRKELIAVLLLIALLFGFSVAASTLLIPKRQNYGSTWGRYLEEDKNSINVLFFGSSITYCDTAPPVIWEEAGISSYVMAGPEQTIPITYYYVEEALKTQSPKAIFVEVTGVFFRQYQDFTKVNIGYMPWGLNRLRATFNAAEMQERRGLVFPLYNYHSRWDSLTREDFEIALKGYSPDDLAGYTFLNTAAEMSGIQPRSEVFDAENYERNLGYLGKIAARCEEAGIDPVFYIAPTYWQLNDKNLARLKDDIDSMVNVRFIDFNADDGLSLYDPERDFYDLLHFNCYGAEKFSANLAQLLTEDMGYSQTEGPDAVLWDSRAEYFRALSDR